MGTMRFLRTRIVAYGLINHVLDDSDAEKCRWASSWVSMMHVGVPVEFGPFSVLRLATVVDFSEFFPLLRNSDFVE